MSKEAEDFLYNLSNWDDLISQSRILIQKDRVYLVPAEFEEKQGLRTLRQGLFLGEMKKNRFQPSQALAIALNQTNMISL